MGGDFIGPLAGGFKWGWRGSGGKAAKSLDRMGGIWFFGLERLLVDVKVGKYRCWAEEMTSFRWIGLALLSVAISGCVSRVQTYEQVSKRIKSDPAPLIQYLGSDEDYHYVFYNPCAGPFILVDPISKLACAEREFRLRRDEVLVFQPIEYHENNKGRRYNLYLDHEKERFFLEFSPR